MKTNYKFGLAVLVGCVNRCSRRHGDSRAANDNVARLRGRGSGRNRCDDFSEVCGKDARNDRSVRVATTLFAVERNTSIEGDAPKRFVVIQFDSVEKAKAWEDSPEYSAIKPIRHSSGEEPRIYHRRGTCFSSG